MTIIPRIKDSLPGTTERVPANTSQWNNRRIREETEKRIHYYVEHPEEIDQGLHDLKREWDIERTLEANAASLALIGIGLGMVNKRFLALSGVATGFLLMHALQGWCPPVPLFRRLGVRTRAEIQSERNSLLALKEALGDFGQRKTMSATEQETAEDSAA